MNRFRYLAGVIPVASLKSRVKWLCDEKPSSRATRDSGVESLRNTSKAFASRRRFTNRPKLRPSVR